MERTKNQILTEINETTDIGALVAILELTASKLDINTISGMADSEGKSPNGIKQSKCYRKIRIGRALLAVKGVRDTNLPF